MEKEETAMGYRTETEEEKNGLGSRTEEDREGKKGQPAGQGDIVRNYETGRRTKAEKIRRESKTEGQGKKKEEGAGQRWRKKQ